MVGRKRHRAGGGRKDVGAGAAWAFSPEKRAVWAPVAIPGGGRGPAGCADPGAWWPVVAPSCGQGLLQGVADGLRMGEFPM